MESQFKDEVYFVVDAAPLPQPRPKARRIGAKAIQIYTPNSAKIKAYKAAVADAYANAAGSFANSLSTDIELDVTFIIKRPANMCGRAYSDEQIPHNKKPDLDNMLKTVMDALNGIAWRDDSNVINISCRKKYANITLGGKSGRKRISAPSQVCVIVKYLNN